MFLFGQAIHADFVGKFKVIILCIVRIMKLYTYIQYTALPLSQALSEEIETFLIAAF